MLSYEKETTIGTTPQAAMLKRDSYSGVEGMEACLVCEHFFPVCVSILPVGTSGLVLCECVWDIVCQLVGG